MRTTLKKELYHEVNRLEHDINISPCGRAEPFTTADAVKYKLADEAFAVADQLRSTPYAPAARVAHLTKTPKQHIPLAYKVIQRCDAAQKHLCTADNDDYFNVVRNYFNNKLFTIVFFVGLSCPSLCAYCPNVRIDKEGKRKLINYSAQAESRLSRDSIEMVFHDLKQLQKKGTHILVKISGGLEPLTDAPTLELIAKLSQKHGFHVKLFTNGILLKLQKRREAVLQTDDIRISLGTTDREQYEEICFGNRRRKTRRNALETLEKSITELTHEREELKRKCKIGFNSVILPSNCKQISRIIKMAWRLGLDYVDFKPDYFSPYKDHIEPRIQSSVTEAKKMLAQKKLQGIKVYFTGTLSKNNLYWQIQDGLCDATKQADYKVFVNPFGQCSPIHFGAFPHPDTPSEEQKGNYFIGRIDHRHGLLDILSRPQHCPLAPLKKLNPFEMMLNLEINREEADEEWGIPINCSPYHTSFRDELPADLWERIYSQATAPM